MSDFGPMTQVSMTPSGRAMHEQLRFKPPYSTVMASLYDHGAITGQELAIACRMSTGKIRTVVGVLERNGYVKVIGGSSGDVRSTSL